MTYLTEEEHYNKYFMQSEFVDFQKAVHLFVANAGISGRLIEHVKLAKAKQTFTQTLDW